jgi:amidophosphoribosyltransferase
MNEECGVFGIYKKDDFIEAADAAFYGLYALQHRGQESAGIAISRKGRVDYHKDMGLVGEIFKDNVLSELYGADIAVAHVRYSTTGRSAVTNAQPLVISYRSGTVALTHNGNLINASGLRKELEEDGAIFQTTIDTEVIANLIARNADDGIIKSIKKTMGRIRGSYAMTIMTKDKLIGVRDPHGIRPLVLGQINESYVLASETAALDAIDAEYLRDIKPGEIVEITENGLKSYMDRPAEKSALCIFEYVYFARPDSYIEGVSVYGAREKAGALLAKRYPVDADIVSGVPDSARPAALGYAEFAGITYKKALAKNRYIGRTFIEPQQYMRERGVKMKLNALRRNVEGKKVVLVDDSIVRGTTSKKIIEMLKNAGAKEVHMRISSPPVIAPCYFGIDTASHEQLIGAKNSIEEIRKLIGADSLYYLSAEDLMETAKDSGIDFCSGCFTKNYPFDVLKEEGKGNKLILEQKGC